MKILLAILILVSLTFAQPKDGSIKFSLDTTYYNKFPTKIFAIRTTSNIPGHYMVQTTLFDLKGNVINILVWH